LISTDDNSPNSQQSVAKGRQVSNPIDVHVYLNRCMDILLAFLLVSVSRKRIIWLTEGKIDTVCLQILPLFLK